MLGSELKGRGTMVGTEGSEGMGVPGGMPVMGKTEGSVESNLEIW